VGSFVTIFALLVLWGFEERLDIENLKPWQFTQIPVLRELAKDD
jgi:hypothetical protein